MSRHSSKDTRYLASRATLKQYDHTCHHCGYPIDMQLRYPHPLAWSCDHIVPTSTLTRDDPRRWHISNLRATHARCNQARGNKPVPPPQKLDW